MKVDLRNHVPRSILSDARAVADFEEMLRDAKVPRGEYQIVVVPGGEVSLPRKRQVVKKTWGFQYRPRKSDVQFFYRLDHGRRRFKCQITKAPANLEMEDLADLLAVAKFRPPSATPKAPPPPTPPVKPPAPPAPPPLPPTKPEKIKLASLTGWHSYPRLTSAYVLALAPVMKACGESGVTTGQAREVFLDRFELPIGTPNKSVGRSIGAFGRKGFLSRNGTKYRFGKRAIEFLAEEEAERIASLPPPPPVKAPESAGLEEVLRRLATLESGQAAIGATLDAIQATLDGQKLTQEVRAALATLARHFGAE